MHTELINIYIDLYVGYINLCMKGDFKMGSSRQLYLEVADCGRFSFTVAYQHTRNIRTFAFHTLIYGRFCENISRLRRVRAGLPTKDVVYIEHDSNHT